MSARVHCSQLLFGELELAVRSELLHDPELFVISCIVDADGKVRNRDHVWVPESVARAARARGEGVLLAFLRATHLRYVQRLLDAPSCDELSVAAVSHGKLLGYRVLDEGLALVRSSGEGAIPSSWLEAESALIELCDGLASALGAGTPRRCVCHGEHIAVALTTVESGDRRERRLAYVESNPRQQAPAAARTRDGVSTARSSGSRSSGRSGSWSRSSMEPR